MLDDKAFLHNKAADYDPFLASFSVKAAGGSGGEIFRQEFFRIEADSSFISKEAWYPYGPACFDGIEGRGWVAQMEEFLQVPHLFAYVDKLEIGIAGEFRLDKVTIRTAWHYVNFGHSEKWLLSNAQR